MGFRIGYQKLLTLRCWHPDYLGAVASLVPVAATDPLSVSERNDYLSYDVRTLLDVRPTPAGEATLTRRGLQWKTSTFGGWMLAKDTYAETDPAVRLQLGVYLRDPRFAATTDFGVTTLEGRLFHLTNATAPASPTFELTGGNLRSVHYVDSQSTHVRLPQVTAGTDGQVLVRDPLLAGNPVLRTVDVAGAAPDPTTYTLDLSDLPAGLYRFTGPNITNVNLLVGFRRDPALLGVIDLRLADWSGAAYDLRFQSSNP
ncbi:hypothetical protein [Lewinella sp. JB7]|uniref:hypothetical protein n=1 Tax=Lewinella sp. JB7 TaxID=2962887 RepID=UPI0020C99C09|nr:hypothetical protein [Lewinella sp. JB7]MCP9234664.1 hypothetical protein [Lewinella sp. JB7]